jgi:hypothetical protein
MYPDGGRKMPTGTMDSEQIDDVPLLMHWMLKMYIE